MLSFIHPASRKFIYFTVTNVVGILRAQTMEFKWNYIYCVDVVYQFGIDEKTMTNYMYGCIC